MNPHVVVDIGNTRIKWGRCSLTGVTEMASLPADDTVAWQAQRDRWNLPARATWVLAGVSPKRRDAVREWLVEGRQDVEVLHSPRQLPLEVGVEEPDKVGIDRLLNAVAVNSRRAPGQSAIVVDAGSAVTVDWVDEGGVFRGGAIFPGFRLMSQALHAYTALLPLVEITQPLPPALGTATRSAVEGGVYWAVAGGIQALTMRLRPPGTRPADIFLGGGDAPLLMPALADRVFILWPEMTLEGIRLAAQSR